MEPNLEKLPYSTRLLHKAKVKDLKVLIKGQQLIANFGVKEFGEPIYYPPTPKR